MTHKNISRRSFLQQASVASAGILIAPTLMSFSANSKLNIAVIGVGNRGNYNLRASAIGNNIVALCDTDDRMMAKAASAFPQAKTFSDFRVMFDQMANEIDAVVVATPDHTHFAAAMAAMELGKHICVEKPLAHSVWQVRTLKKAANYYGVVSQMANQGHTTNGIRTIKELYDNDVLGEVKEVVAWRGFNKFKPNFYFTKPENYPPIAETVPNFLNWDAWQGPVVNKSYNHVYTPKSWRGFYDFGNGQLGDWACHTLDAPFWALELGSPKTVFAEIPNGEFNHNSFMPNKSKVTFKFPKRGKKPKVTMTWYEGLGAPDIAIRKEWGIEKLPAGGGMLMIGDKNTAFHGARPNDGKLLIPNADWEEFKKNKHQQTIARIAEEKPHQEWIEAIKNDRLPGSNFNYASDLTEMALVGVIAQRFGGKIKFDSDKMKITNRKELNKYIKEPVREGWSYGENLWK